MAAHNSGSKLSKSSLSKIIGSPCMSFGIF
jgi:hypothetical protein